VQPATAPDGKFAKDHFQIDLEAKTVLCPAGRLAVIRPVGEGGSGVRRPERHLPPATGLCVPYSDEDKRTNNFFVHFLVASSLARCYKLNHRGHMKTARATYAGYETNNRALVVCLSGRGWNDLHIASRFQPGDSSAALPTRGSGS
ncbi:MAG TPA: hypothetical protein VH877_19900, partial [Polyangia bacterium]|nr:hypothetical protein [Polyangia bacterium]